MKNAWIVRKCNIFTARSQNYCSWNGHDLTKFPCLPFLKLDSFNVHTSKQYYSSSLFITNDKLSQLCSTVIPYIDVISVLNNQPNIVDNLKRRNRKVDEYNFEQINKKHKEFVRIDKIITDLSYKIIMIEKELISNKTQLTDERKTELTNEKVKCKSEIKQYDSVIVDYQKSVLLKLLSIPNEIDETTTDNFDLIHRSVLENESVQNDKLVDALKKYVIFKSKLNTNFLNEAAEFEYLFPILFKTYLVNNYNFVPFTNTDLCKSPIIEGTGVNYMCPLDNLLLVNNEYKYNSLGYNELRYHLVGASSMSLFCAYHANQSVHVKDLPIKYVTNGKKYGFDNLICNDSGITDLRRENKEDDVGLHENLRTNIENRNKDRLYKNKKKIEDIKTVNENLNESDRFQSETEINSGINLNGNFSVEEIRNLLSDMYNCVQKENVSMFFGTNSKEHLQVEVESLQVLLSNLFDKLHVNFQLVKVPAYKLSQSESLRLEYRVFSPSLQCWVVCCNIRVHTDYVSKRLNMCYHSQSTSYERHYLFVLNSNFYVNSLLVNLIEFDRGLMSSVKNVF